jgi:hypothetical protein
MFAAISSPAHAGWRPPKPRPAPAMPRTPSSASIRSRAAAAPRAASTNEAFLFARYSPPQYDASIPVVAFARSCVSLIVPGMRSHQAVTSIRRGRFPSNLERLRATSACRARLWSRRLPAGRKHWPSPMSCSTRGETLMKKFSLSWIALMTCLAIVGLSASGCAQTISGAMGDVSTPSVAVPPCHRAPSPAPGCTGGG